MANHNPVAAGRSPTAGLLIGLAVTLSAVAVYSGYTIHQLRDLRELQAGTIDRNRTDSHLLLRIQNDLNAMALTIRDMLDASEPYPLAAWQGQCRRIRLDLEDALSREEQVSPPFRDPDQRKYLAVSNTQFWDALDRIFDLANQGDEKEARARLRLSLQAREAALSSQVARLLIQNNENDQQVAAHTAQVYFDAERNAYLFLAAAVLLVIATSLYLMRQNRKMFEHVATLSQQRSDLAQQLISTQENTFRYISRELHDEFGQILTAIGAMLQRAARRAPAIDPALHTDLNEVRDIVQSTLEKTRALSHAIHPVALEETTLEDALGTHIPAFEKQMGIEIRYEASGEAPEIGRNTATHVYRVLQEALNNVARHSKSKQADVRIRYLPGALVLEIEDHGVGLANSAKGSGIGLVSMRERAGLMKGRLELLTPAEGGLLVRLTAPLNMDEVPAGA